MLQPIGKVDCPAFVPFSLRSPLPAPVPNEGDGCQASGVHQGRQSGSRLPGPGQATHFRIPDRAERLALIEPVPTEL